MQRLKSDTYIPKKRSKFAPYIAALIIVGLMGLVYYYLFFSKAGGKLWKPHSQIFLNNLVKDIEFYKNINGVYPDSLEQLSKNSLWGTNDPIYRGNKNIKFNYKRIGNKYTLYSSGVDQIP